MPILKTTADYSALEDVKIVLSTKYQFDIGSIDEAVTTVSVRLKEEEDKREKIISKETNYRFNL